MFLRALQTAYVTRSDSQEISKELFGRGGSKEFHLPKTSPDKSSTIMLDLIFGRKNKGV
jgi:hypothetical protein